MPSPANPNGPSNRAGGAKASPTKQKALDIGLPLGIYDTNSVRAKVRKWQQQGGGVITADEVIYYEDDDENSSTTESKSKPTKVKEASRSITSTTTRKRSKSTPRKRLISDEHWKLNRTPTQAPGAKLPAPRRIAQYTTNDPVPTTRSEKSENVEKTEMVDKATKTETKKDVKPRPLQPTRNRDGDKVNTAPLPVARERRKSKASRDVDAIIEKIEREHALYTRGSKSASRPSTADKPWASALSEPSGSPTKRDLALDYDSEWATSEADFSELSRRRARGVNHVPKSRNSVKPPKGGIFGQMLDESRKMFSRPEPPKAPVQNRGSKIEAWLSNTPDPFLDDKEPDVEIPAPLKTRANKNTPSPKHDEKSNKVVSPDPSVDSDTPRKSNTQKAKSRESTPGSEAKKGKQGKANATAPPNDASPTSRRKRSGEHKHRRASGSSKGEAGPKKVRDKADVLADSESYLLSSESEVSGSNPPVLLSRKRPFPSTGVHRLSTIASVQSMTVAGQAQAQGSDIASNKGSAIEIKEEEEETDYFDLNALPLVSSQLKRLTTHDDLISVLSAPNTRSRSIRSARSLRSNKSRSAATVSDILKELSADEAKYMRELKTLVGGVIPVLLTCVLSRSDSAIAAGLFRPSADPKDELNFTKPIVNMGVAIERLKSLHKRIPQDNADSLLQWAYGAQRVYREYLKAWRLGFKDVVVNLAPLEEGEGLNNSDTKSLDEGMARDENGDVVDSDGQKVDVAYLLKRPLVRLKYLAKTFKGINMLQPSPKAEEVAVQYQDLVTDARRRAREERARLEDESAAAIDPTRARDPQSLAALTGVTIDKDRRVRARDFFNLSLYHSSGQVIDCRAELLLRDNASEKSAGGDLLICEIDHAERWLLFPPMALSCISARNGDKKGEVVVMLRSPPGSEKRFQELLLLRIDEEDVGFEWVQMLGLNPVPPALCRSQSFIERAKQRQRAQTVSSPSDVVASQGTPPSPTNIAIPIGEKATSRPSRRSWTPKDKDQLSEQSTVESSFLTESRISNSTEITRESNFARPELEQSIKPTSQPQAPILHSRDPRKSLVGDEKTSSGLKRSKAKRISRYGEATPQSPLSPETPTKNGNASLPEPSRDADEKKQPDQSTLRENKLPKEQHPPSTPTGNANESSPRVSSVPSMDLPLIPKLRQGSSSTYLPDASETDLDEDYEILSSFSETPTKSKRHSRGSESDTANEREPPPPPPHSRSPSSTGSSLPNTPLLSPTSARPRRRGSSPLKHEYEPSTASDTYSESDTSTVRHYEMYSDSDSSATDSSDDDSEGEITSTLPPIVVRKPSVLDSPATSSLSLSNSAPQAGYRSVPSQPNKSSSAIASVFAWSDKGSWESIFPDECRILVSPGLIEAYEMKDAPSGESDDETQSKTSRPIIALELTPLVPIRRGTAIDISIRSPPTDRSKITWSNNIMFRSRNADECEALYGFINHSRINNPTYIALQNARGPLADLSQPLERSTNTGGGLFGWPRRRKSYRASSSPRSLADNSESSVGTMSSAFSALKRFGAGSKMFSISRSSVTSRSGPKEGSLYSSSAGSGSNNMPSGISRIAAAIKGVDGIGLSNAKIRLYIRETQSKWRDMGAARLTIMPATPEPLRPDTAVSRSSDTSATVEGTDGDGNSPPDSGAASPRRGMEQRKRILIRGKTRGEVLLDVCLDESCFERVARTGIAVSIREENEGKALPQKGGVTGGSSTVYMIQMKGEAEAAYTFGLVGKLKY